jgi:hypothetical protein
VAGRLRSHRGEPHAGARAHGARQPGRRS